MIVDPDVREGIGLSPDLAMSSTGQADVVYRVVELPEQRSRCCVPATSSSSVRVASFQGERWSALGSDQPRSRRFDAGAHRGQRADGRDRPDRQRRRSPGRSPKSSGVARIWARRIFGQTLDYVMPVTATAFASTPVGQDADAPSVAVSRLGQAEVAYRQAYGVGSPLPGPRIFLNTLPDGESESGAEFLGAGIADSAVSGGKEATLGRPSIDLNERREMRLLYDSNGAPRVVEGNDKGLAGTVSLGPPIVGSQLAAAGELPVASVMNPEGGGVSAWPSADPQGRPAVAVREDFPSGAVQTALVSGGAGGPIGELAVGRSDLGDGLVAFQQGPIGNAAIVGAQVTAPPAPFVITVPRTLGQTVGRARRLAALGERERAGHVHGRARRQAASHATRPERVRDRPARPRQRRTQRATARHRHLRAVGADGAGRAESRRPGAHRARQALAGRRDGPGQRQRLGLGRALGRGVLRRRLQSARARAPAPPLRARGCLFGGRARSRQARQLRHVPPGGERGMRRIATSAVLALIDGHARAARARRRVRLALARSLPRRSSRLSTPTTRPSPATDAMSSSTARSPA